MVYQQMLSAVEELSERANNFPWENKDKYIDWLAQSFFYVSWTTRQLALASAYTKPGADDIYHWRFIEEAKEEKKHELLALHDLKTFGYEPSQFHEYPHTSFFYQTLTYMIEHEHPMAIIGYSLTLEGFAALKADTIYQRVLKSYGEVASTFLRVHCELDKDHFSNALPYLETCPTHLLPVISKSIEQCKAIYMGILDDIESAQKIVKPMNQSNQLEI